MAVYKVPQDVEAEDKLIGPFSFRQFIYLIIAAASGAMAFFLFNVSPILFMLPLPILFLFGALALPLKKDQPLETYFLAVIRFYLKPKIRLWDPEGSVGNVEIAAQKKPEEKLSKDYSGETAQERLDYLARIMDSRGWAFKGAAAPVNASITQTVAAEASSAVDVLDEQATLSRSLQSMITQKDQQTRAAAIAKMRSGGKTNMPGAAAPTFNPYPTSMHQKVILPPGQQPKATAKPAPVPAQKPATSTVVSTMPSPASPAIMNLANNKDLSVSAIASEARRLVAKEGEEVVVRLH